MIQYFGLSGFSVAEVQRDVTFNMLLVFCPRGLDSEFLASHMNRFSTTQCTSDDCFWITTILRWKYHGRIPVANHGTD